MPQINCLRCRQSIESELEQCPHCGERVTHFQRTYAARLIDGKYQILDRLGIGGMGEIFKVRHIHLNELRVIKIMRPNVAQDEQGLQRFLQEARTSTMIKHRNLAMLYDFSQLDDGSYYMVWEFIDGTNIQKWMAANGPVPPRLTVEIAIQALNGLDHLHSMGLIHRDISPENIMLSQDRAGKLLVKVIDFGIAKQLTAGDQGLTQTGMFLGKLKYASPEQAGFLKEGEHIDPRSDLYSFGIVLYEMLAGRAPFVATNPHVYILKHVSEKPASIHDISPLVKVPPQLEAIIFKALEKNRDQRFASAEEFAAAMEGIRNSIPPDQKYGLGEKLVTLSGAQTLADLAARPAPTAPGTTERSEPVPRLGPTGTVEQKPTIGSNDATVVENLATASSAVPTMLESKVAAEPTVIETKVAPRPEPAKRSKVPFYGGIAAVVAIVLALGGWFAFHQPQQQQINPTTAPVASTTVSVTAPPVSTNPNQGVLLLAASPWGDIEKIVNTKDNKPVDITDDSRSTPTRIQLDPGNYRVVLNGPQGTTKTIDVKIDAGKPARKQVDMGNVDINEIEQEMQKQ
jgi:serine/threonine-protein kinase